MKRRTCRIDTVEEIWSKINRMCEYMYIFNKKKKSIVKNKKTIVFFSFLSRMHFLY